VMFSWCLTEARWRRAETSQGYDVCANARYGSFPELGVVILFL
jgi:hypothetical protein